jgi:hypothetical protein
VSDLVQYKANSEQHVDSEDEIKFTESPKSARVSLSTTRLLSRFRFKLQNARIRFGARRRKSTAVNRKTKTMQKNRARSDTIFAFRVLAEGTL